MKIVKMLQKHMDSELTQKTIQASLMKLGLWTGGSVLIMHVIFFRGHMKIVVAMVTDIIKMFHR